MSKSTESAFTHPSIEELDRWRAGLFEDDPARQATLAGHVKNCAACRATMAPWNRAHALLDAAANDSAITAQLRGRRERVLAGRRAKRPRTAVALALAATLTAVAVGVTTFLHSGGRGQEPAAFAASETADFYADIDFYLWLMEKQANQNATPRG